MAAAPLFLHSLPLLRGPSGDDLQLLLLWTPLRVSFLLNLVFLSDLLRMVQAVELLCLLADCFRLQWQPLGPLGPSVQALPAPSLLLPFILILLWAV